MPSPFPGMDPYLEGREWGSLHIELSSEIARQLAPQLRPKYIARTMHRFITDGVGITPTDIYPDVGVVETSPIGTAPVVDAAPLTMATIIPEAEPEVTVEIRDVTQRRLVTSIEVLSPVNKRGAGYQAYVEKRNRVLQSRTHLIEIDLLRRGKRVPMADKLPSQASYFIFLSRVGQRPMVEFWPIPLNTPLPTIPVPLLDNDADISLSLQSVFDTVYDTLGYDLVVDYHAPPDVPFSKTEASQAEPFVTFQ